MRRMELFTHPTLDQLHQLGLTGMARAFIELEANPNSAALSHAEWLGLLLDREITERYERRLRARLRFARLRHQAAVEDVDYRAARGLDRALFQALIAGRWIEEAQNLIIEGPAGVGKSWLACALGHKACRDNRSVLYQRFPKMFADLALARGDGRYPRLMRALGGVKLLILDDWGLESLGPEQRHDLLEIVEERYGRGATLITSQLPVDRWHDLIGEPTLADAILDRVIPNPADQCAGELGGVTAGHQAKWVAALITSGMSARVRQRSLSAASRSLSVAKCLFATASSASGHRCSAGCSSGV